MRSTIKLLLIPCFIVFLASCNLSPWQGQGSFSLRLDNTDSSRGLVDGDVLSITLTGEETISWGPESITADGSAVEVEIPHVPFGNYTIEANVETADGRKLYSGSAAFECNLGSTTTTLRLNAHGAISSFRIQNKDAVIQEIDESNGTITLQLPFWSSLSSLTPELVWEGRSVSPASGALDFSSTVAFVVTRANTTTKTYAATVTLEPPPFQSSASIGSAGNYYNFALGDINNDSLSDIIIESAQDSHKVFLSQSNGTFSQPQTLNSNVKDIYGSWLGDVTNDGYPEFLTAGPNGATDSHNAVYLNTAGTLATSGSTTYVLTSNTVAFYGWQPITTNLNGDAYDDVLWWQSGTLRKGFSNGSGGFSSMGSDTMATAGSEYAGILSADLDNDGDMDVITSKRFNGTGQGSISIFVNNGSGTLTLVTLNQSTHPSFSTYFNPIGIAAGDYNDDGKQELLFINSGTNSADANQGYWLGTRTSADGASPTYTFAKLSNALFDPAGVYGFGIATNRLSTGDIDGDGADDLLVSTVTASHGVFVLYGSKTSPLTNGYLIYSPGVSSSRLADMNGDGKLDAVIREGLQIKVFYQ